MSVIAPTETVLPRRGRPPSELFGGWEVGLIGFMGLVYLAGLAVNPGFFGTSDALSAVLRDSARFGVMAVGMTFVIVNRDLDLSVGSTFGLVAIVFSILFAPTALDMGAWQAAAICLCLGAAIGLLNGVLVTILRVPAFIATLTMLFIGRGLVLGLSGGKTIAYDQKAEDFLIFFQIGETNALGFNNQIFIFLALALIGAVVLAKTRIGYESYAVGGNALAADYAGIPSRRVRIRGYVLSALAASLAGLMNVAQDKTVTSQSGQGAELIVIAAVIVGGASILGGRGRVLGACLGAALVVLIDKVLREGVPIVRMIEVAGIPMEVRAMAQLPPGAVPAFLGLILLLAVLIEPVLLRRNVLGRFLARLRGRPLPPIADAGGAAIVGVQTRGTTGSGSFAPRGLARLFARRDAAAIVLMLLLWVTGAWLRPDYWASLDNTFNLALAFTEIALLSIGLTFVIANGDIDLSVGSVLAFSGATAAFLMKEMSASPGIAVLVAFAGGTLCGVLNGWLVTRLKLPAFVATLGLFYIARGLAAWLVAGRQLSGFPESFNLLGRKLIEVLESWGFTLDPGILQAIAAALSVQTLLMGFLAIVAAWVLGRMPFGQMVYAVGGNERAARYAGIPVGRVRFVSLVFSGMCAALAGIIYVAYLRSFNPSAGLLRELDAIAAVIIGGGSIFGGYGTILGSLAGAAVITLIRSLLALQVILPDGSSFVMPQHWVNVFIGLILIAAVIGDIWLRQERILVRLRERFFTRRTSTGGTANV